ncbi:hypothetical protein [Algoriphagus aquimarinus]|uniref:tyrosine-type recombinase/integrase n=1 Tax=Algoriphagus aquimarinus TaxID=237018 RepID=UPI0030D94915
MNTLFFLKKPSADQTSTNSLILRFKLVGTTSPKVKGLKISCSKKDWNQQDQQVRRSHSQYKKLNEQLEFITKQIQGIEKERNVSVSDIDRIVEASIKGISVQELENDSQQLTSMVKMMQDHVKDNPVYSPHYKRKFDSTLSNLQKIEEQLKYRINANNLNKSSITIQTEIVNYFRKNGRKDSTARNFLTVLNACINHYNDHTNNEIKTFTKKSTKWSKEKKAIIFLNDLELKTLYNFVFIPDPSLVKKPTQVELKKLKYFLFRCFCGMRVSDMNMKNVNPERLKRDSKTFTYFQDKGTKEATVYCINEYLYTIATSLEWDFPTFSTNSALTNFGIKESVAVRKYLKQLFLGKLRKVKHYTETGYVTANLVDEITSHTARKTFAHMLYRLSNNNLLLVMHQLGHTKLEITQNYLGIDLNEEETDFKNVNLGF